MTGRASTRATDERRWSAGAWLTLALALGYLVAGVAYVLAAYRQPSEGWHTIFNASTGWQVQLDQGGSTLLRVGDRILAIEGESVEQHEAFLPRRDPPPGWEVGRSTRYTVLRDGAVIELDIPLVQIAPRELPRFMLVGTDGTNFAALICLLFGFAIFLLRPGSVAARLLLLILTYFMGSATIWMAVATPTLQFQPPLLYWTYQGTGLLWPLLFAAMTHLTLTFPQPVWPLTRWPRLTLGLLYGLPGAGALTSIATLSVTIYGPTLIATMLAMVCAVIGATIANLRTTHDPVVRAQSAWVGLGLGGTFVFSAVGAIVSILFPNGGEWSGYLFVLVLPVCLGIAILRYRLFDVEVIIRRTLVYTVLTLTLGALYLLSVVTLQSIFVRLTGQESTLAVVASTLASATLFGPLRRQVQGLIDRRFFRRKYDARRVLEEFGQRAQQEADLDALSADVLHVVRETLEPDGVRLWLAPQRSDSPRARGVQLDG